jgi:23S rRNA (cytidine1920-2'-O)/16S rRNA (cytidine1409-2'-O)-methyltransferase
MHAKIRRDSRVVAREGINARYLEPQDIGEPIDLVVVDVSFISLKLILPPLVDIIAPDGEIVALVKPQFEVGKDLLPKDGVVKSKEDRDAVLTDLRTFIENETPWKVIANMVSPIQGEKGNLEYCLLSRVRRGTWNTAFSSANGPNRLSGPQPRLVPLCSSRYIIS